MTFKFILGILAAVLSLVGYIPYLRDVFKKKTTPHSYSWLIWSILQITAVVAIITNRGGYYGSFGIMAGAFFCLLIFFLSFKYGTKNITQLDSTSLFAALIAILIWICTKDATYSVVLISLIDFAGFLPTLRKGYEEPMSETMSTYVFSIISCILSVCALSTYSISTVTYLSTLVFSNSLFVVILLWRRNIMIKK